MESALLAHEAGVGQGHCDWGGPGEPLQAVSSSPNRYAMSLHFNFCAPAITLIENWPSGVNECTGDLTTVIEVKSAVLTNLYEYHR
jgi:hypothetical protein